MVAHRGKKISFYDMTKIFSVAYNRVATVKKAVNGFRKCGLWPFYDHIFTDEDFAPSNPETAFPLLDMDSTALQDVSQQCPRLQENDKEYNERPQETQQVDTQQEERPLRLVENPESQPTQESCSQDDVPSTSGLQSDTTAIRARRVLFELCLPTQDRSGENPKKARKHPSEQSQHLTSSPYKNILAEKAKKRLATVERAKKKTTAKKRTVKTTNHTVLDYGSDDEAWPCLVCGEPYSNSKPGEEWIQCNMCKHWAHQDCTPRDCYYYICQNYDSDDDTI